MHLSPSFAGTILERHKFLTLDTLRGVAALAVLEFHTSGFTGHQLFPHGYLAVDFFFMLSGFVITFAYQDKLNLDLSTAEFLKIRLTRLYPLYFLGLMLGLLLSIVQYCIGRNHLSASSLGYFLALGLFLLPAPSALQAGGPASFPFDTPTWSIFYELIANLLHSLFFRRRSWKFFVGIVLSSEVTLLYSANKLGTMDFGSRRTEVVYGLSRVIFAYTVGILVYLVWEKGRHRINVPPFILSILLLAVLAVHTTARSSLTYDVLVTTCFFPIFLCVSASSVTSLRFTHVSRALGLSSYAVYVLHVPIFLWFERVWIALRGYNPTTAAPWVGIFYFALTILLALLGDRYYDLRARRILRNWLLPRAAAVEVSARAIADARETTLQLPA
jgi:peptidoglycan/LPS O-acetylase OafA/YrhL